MTAIIKLFGWRDMLDIVLVSIILYRLLVLVKGTKAAQMLIGLILLLLASAVSRYTPFYTLDWLLQGFWAYIVIALIVLFQPEIRRVLAKMGETPFLRAFTSAEELRSLEEIVRASVSMANRKIGALVVIERETDLKDFVEIGTPLDAKVSKEILTSIFHPTSPIHDGAVVIRGNRIVAAGCFLPVAPEPDISKTLGTRHRAALGLTGETDAIAVIVSEETGIISMAIGDNLETHLDMGTLRDRLTDMFTAKKVSK
ncbi:MAG: diadenylate cyclase CdaA [Thermodesulfovibrionales bacterium]|nr:diadenylate cyclase CdaA [Thermodesulfovibrionales bacterium]